VHVFMHFAYYVYGYVDDRICEADMLCK